MTVIPSMFAPCKRLTGTETFYNDVVRGLTASQKYLDSKYFYDAKGDALFQEIMHSHEYYLTNCEMEIFSEQSAGLAAALSAQGEDFDIIELGAGDATKSSHLLKYLAENNATFTYYPIDISGNVISQLEKNLPVQIPGLRVHGLNGEYFEMLKLANRLSSRKKVLLFMGANIGNFTIAAARRFCRELRDMLRPGDMLLTGFDLKKHPGMILSAYNDAAGITRAFNLNLLERINRELDADFDVNKFEHFPTYDPGTGSCKSYLVSLEAHEVHIGDAVTVSFQEHEALYMEISQKYSIQDIAQLATVAGFEATHSFFDSRHWFTDCLWECR